MPPFLPICRENSSPLTSQARQFYCMVTVPLMEKVLEPLRLGLPKTQGWTKPQVVPINKEVGFKNQKTHTRQTSVTTRIIIVFWSRREHIKHGYCSNNHTYDHLVIRNSDEGRFIKSKTQLLSPFLCIRGTHVQIPTSFSRKNKKTKRNNRAGQRTVRSMWRTWGTGSIFSWFRRSFGGILTHPLMSWHHEKATHFT